MWDLDQRQVTSNTEWQEKLGHHLPELRDEIIDALSGVYECGPKKWHEIPFVHGFPRFQDYIEGHVCVCLPFRAAGGAMNFESISVGESCNAAVFKIDCRASGDVDFGIGSVSALRDYNKHVMFIPIIDLPDEPQNFVASFVGFKVIKKETLCAGEGTLYRSIDGRYYTVSVAARQGMLGLISIDGAVKPHPTTIQCGTKAENDIADPTGDPWLNVEVPDGGHPRLSVERTASGFFMSIDQYPQGSIQIVDLLLGPSDLVNGTLE